MHVREQSAHGVSTENAERQRIYHGIQKDFRTTGLALDATITQGLRMSDIFLVSHGLQILELHIGECCIGASTEAFKILILDLWVLCTLQW